MSGEAWLAIMLAVAVAVAWVRLSWPPIRAAWWRVATLMVLNALAAAMLYATLLPPRIGGRAGELVVATAGTPRLAPLAAGARLVTLPEAGRVEGAERAPDLATALRRHPGTRSVRILGSGLEARDWHAVAGLAVAFDPPPEPRGLVGLYPPADAAPGGAFRVGARVVGAATVELLDPAGRLVDRVAPPADGQVVLGGTARAPGTALFRLRVRDGGGTVTGEAAVPVVTVAPPATRMLIVAGAPGPEVKFLRRWATDAGLAPLLRANLGGGVGLGDAPALSAATLARIDVAVFDDRGWAALSAGERAAVGAAVRGGMGALLRVTGPVPPAVRSQWRAMGLDVAGGQAIAPVALTPAAPSEMALQARRDPGNADVPAAAQGARDDLPQLTRRAATLAGAVPLVRDARGAMLGGWRAAGRGRIGAWLVEDGFGLVTAGHGDRYGEWWSLMASTLARPDPRRIAAVDPLPRAGERMTVCDLPAGPVTMTDPGGRAATLVADPVAGGCAGYWPIGSGWHRLAAAGLAQPVYVQPGDALPGVRADARRAATLLAVLARADAAIDAPADVRGPSWPWFLAWLVVTAGCWWLERSRLGRRPAA